MWSCPNCQRPLPPTLRVFGASRGRQWRCVHCDALLRVRGSANVAIGAFFGAVVGVLFGYFVRIESRYISGAMFGIVMALVITLVNRCCSQIVVQEADHPSCAKCGYDLYANTTGRCPECGTEYDGKSVVNNE